MSKMPLQELEGQKATLEELTSVKLKLTTKRKSVQLSDEPKEQEEKEVLNLSPRRLCHRKKGHSALFSTNSGQVLHTTLNNQCIV